MMKKVWLVLLAVVLVFGLVVSCGGGSKNDDDDDGDLVEKDVFILSTDEGIQALTVGPLSFADDANPIKPLVRAGGDTAISIEAITTPGGTKGLKFKTAVNWGAGIDLPYTEFAFREGDVVTVKGKLIAGGRVQLNSKEGGEAVIPTATSSEIDDFDFNVTLTAADVANIKAGTTTKVIRIEGRPENVEVEVYEITIKGKRPSNLAKLATPVITATANGIGWEPIENTSGYKVYGALDGEDYDEEEGFVELGPSATGLSLADLDDGIYKIKVIALGLKNVSTDSDPAEAKVSKATPPQTVIDIDVSGVTGVKGAVSAATADGFTFTYPSSGTDINYQNSYAYFQYNLSPKTLADLLEVTFNFQGATGDFGYKNINLHAFASVPSGWLNPNNAIAPQIATGYDGVAEKSFTFTVDHTKTTTIETETNLYFVIICELNSGANGYKISDVKFKVGDPATYTLLVD